MAENSFADRLVHILAMASREPALRPEAPDDQLRVGFSWATKVEYAFFYFGKSQGYYHAEDLEVTFCEGSGSQAALEALQRGEIDLLVLPCTFAFSAIRDGLPVKIISLYQPSAPVCLVSHTDCPVSAPKHLEGKRIARLSSETGTAFLNRLCALHDVHYDQLCFVDVRREDKIDAFLRREVDVISVYRTNDLHILKSQPEYSFCELDIAAFGLHLPGMCAVASDAFIEAMPSVIDRFLVATQNATIAGMNDRCELREVARRIPGASAKDEIIAAQIDELIASLRTDNGVPNTYCDSQTVQKGLLALEQESAEIPREYAYVSRCFQEMPQ